MEIYLIRHTQTATASGLCYGQTDVPLAESFNDEARCIQKKLPELSPECLIYSSPLSRCMALAESFNRPIAVDARLKEVDFGDWENRLFNAIEPDLVKNWAAHFVTVAPPNGENFSQLCHRVSDFWDELVSKTTADQVLLVTHAGVIRALFAHILQLPPTNAFRFRVDAGSIHKLQYINNYTYVHYVNL